MRNCTNSSNYMPRKRCWRSKRYKQSERKDWPSSQPCTSQRSFLEVGWTTKTIRRDTSQSASSQVRSSPLRRNTTLSGIRSSPNKLWSITFTRMSKLMRSSRVLLKTSKGCPLLIWILTSFMRCPLKRKSERALKIGKRRKQMMPKPHLSPWSGWIRSHQLSLPKLSSHSTYWKLRETQILLLTSQ